MMFKKNGYKYLIVLIAGLFLFPGCPPGKMPIDVDAQAKKMAPPEGKALVYVYSVTPINAKIYCSGKYIGKIGKERYIYTVISPGIYDFAVDPDDTEQYRLEISEGKVYYLEMQSDSGFVGPSFEFFRVKDETAKFRMRKCWLSKELGSMLD